MSRYAWWNGWRDRPTIVHIDDSKYLLAGAHPQSSLAPIDVISKWIRMRKSDHVSSSNTVSKTTSTVKM